MWWLEGGAMRTDIFKKFSSVFMVIGLAAVTAGCFQPLYGERSTTAVPGGPNIQEALSGVEVEKIPAGGGSPEERIAVEVQNDLIFSLTGGGTANYATHKVRVRISSTRLSVIVDTRSARPDVENYGLNATYELVDLKTGKVVLKDQTFSRVSYDIPGQQQRFARQRGLRDAENRAAQTLAENIRNRLASFFVAGT
jgi:LPS-assembly lipoprotein